MEYAIHQLARLAGVSTRTLRYYDSIGLLRPCRVSSGGYRIYGPREVDLLQQILFYREMELSLQEIGRLLAMPDYSPIEALTGHREQLMLKRAQLDRLIGNVEKTIASMKGENEMSDQEKFEGFKKSLVEENEKKYGKEIREKYGEDAVERSNRKVLNMTKQQSEEITALGEEVLKTLEAALETGDPAGELAQKAADLHRRWLTFYWDSYSPEAHAGIAEMYVQDPRFTAYYDKVKPGMANFLRDAVIIYTGKKSEQ